MIETVFTPGIATLGGGLIGVAAVLLMLVSGRIFGATGIVTGIIAPGTLTDRAWRIALLLGMMTGPVAAMLLTGNWLEIQVPVSRMMLILSGVLVGIGVTFGSGCTSGHGVCGMARLSPRSIAATLTFMVTTTITVYVIRHVIGG